MRTLRVFVLIVMPAGSYAIAGGMLGGCGRDNDCDSDADCPDRETCVLCSNKQVVASVRSGSPWLCATRKRGTAMTPGNHPHEKGRIRHEKIDCRRSSAVECVGLR